MQHAVAEELYSTKYYHAWKKLQSCANISIAADGYAPGTVTALNAYIANNPTHFACREISINLQAQQQQSLER